MPRALDLPGEVTLAAGTVPGLAAWTDFTHLGDIALEGVNIFIIEALTIGAVIGLAWPTTPTPTKASRFPSTATPVTPASLE
jgi:hypothetical protein